MARLVREGYVTVNGEESKPGRALKPGDRVEVRFPPPVPLEVEPDPMDLVLLYRDEHILVINKPAGVCVHPGAGRTRGTIVNGLLALSPKLSTIGGVERPGIVHRLDRDTSGCLIVALNDRAHLALSEDFKERRIKKAYLAVVVGLPPFHTRMIREPIGRHPTRRKQMAVRPEGREAETKVTLVMRGKELSLVRAEPFTGRTHQIRVHLAHEGYPVLGDTLYGRRKSPAAFLRQALHARRLTFDHPVTGETLTVRAPLPDDMVHLLTERDLMPGLLDEEEEGGTS